MKQQRTGGTSNSRGHVGHQTAEDRRDSKQQGTGGNYSRIRQTGHQAVEDNMDNKQQRAFRTFKQQRTVKTSSSKGYSGSGRQGDEDKQDIKQQMTGGTSSSRGQHGHQATKGI